MSIKPTLHLKRRTYTIIFSLALIGSLIGWGIVEFNNTSSQALRLIFIINTLFHPTAIFLTRRKNASLKTVDLMTVCFGISINVLTMGIAFYGPYNEGFAVDVLYLWLPAIYIFVFASFQRKAALKISALMWGILFLISLPLIFQLGNTQYIRLTAQMHLMSVALIASLSFFASFQQRLHLAELSVDEMAKLANTDELTQVANRRRIDEVMKHELLRYSRYEHPFSIILFDIDHFKKVNDSFGHDVGDHILIELAEHSRKVLREVDTLGRWGGEEFVIIMPETSFHEAFEKAQQLCDRVASAVFKGQHMITLSCGVTELRASDSVESAFQRADAALYRAKNKGRNRVEGRPNQAPELNVKAVAQHV